MSVTVEVDQHLDHSGVTCDDILRFLHLQADIGTHTRLVQDRTLCPHQSRDVDRSEPKTERLIMSEWMDFKLQIRCEGRYR